ncbi:MULTISPECIES: TetR/AcrR family transcriptional regulator [Nitrospirillum]|uniref:TetR family transcriptional regulator n=2 Tax=Nitrospirillum TaxID=1543705 RepID=A0A560FVM4_9PROT|nr:MULTISPECIES: TetR/AcrR family transcriptional regulator [Nitrospirillum]MBB6255359.1 AcrR family transcriptional regulator [Nitrospirillum iridis]TWB25698.1 TetR family transcriptional regulator [Nitrospirillum amazonense]
MSETLDTSDMTPARPKRTGAGRPTQAQVRAIDAAILETATSAFLTAGYSGTSMEAVAEAARVSKGTLYARYPSKADLFKAVCSSRVEVWSTRFTPEPASGSGLTQRLEHFARTIVRSMSDPEVMAFEGLLHTEGRNFPEVAKLFFDTTFEVSLAQVMSILTAASIQDGTPIRDARNAAVAFMGLFTGWWMRIRWCGPISGDEVEATIRSFVAIFLQGRTAW